MGMQEQAMRLTPGQRTGVRIAGILITLAGVVFVVLAFAQFFSGMTSVGGENGFDSGRDHAINTFILFAIGVGLLMVGTPLLRLGFLRPISQLVATETEGALGVAGGALSKGWHGSRGTGGQEQVKVRCRECGSLESETAKFCSECGKAL